jgi:hypothetical protein
VKGGNSGSIDGEIEGWALRGREEDRNGDRRTLQPAELRKTGSLLVTFVPAGPFDQ